jgi:hypothetical protein
LACKEATVLLLLISVSVMVPCLACVEGREGGRRREGVNETRVGAKPQGKTCKCGREMNKAFLLCGYWKGAGKGRP